MTNEQESSSTPAGPPSDEDLLNIARSPRSTDAEKAAAAAELERRQQAGPKPGTPEAMAAEADKAEAELAALEQRAAAKGEEEPTLLFSREVSLPVDYPGDEEGATRTIKTAFQMRCFSEEGSLVLHLAARAHDQEGYGEPATIFIEDGAFREDSESREFFERCPKATRDELQRYCVLQLQRLEGRPGAVIR